MPDNFFYYLNKAKWKIVIFLLTIYKKIQSKEK